MSEPIDPSERETFPAMESGLRAHLHGPDLGGVDPGIRLGTADEVDANGNPLDPVAARLGTTAARYVRLGELGRGGMGTVYKVLDTDLHRRLALKVIRNPGTAGGGMSERSRDLLTRFLEEAQVTGQLDHPGIVPLHEIGVDKDGCIFFTMRLVKGRHLGEVFKLARTGSEGWTRDRIIPLLMKVCEAMSYAHSRGVVHRDLKPENIMVGSFGEAYVMDWGLAKVVGRKHGAPAGDPRRGDTTGGTTSQTVRVDRVSAGPGGARETRMGTVVGTLSFMAPEQARGELDAIDARSDVYSFGAVLYELLSGHAPYTTPNPRATALEILQRVISGPPTPLRQLEPGVSPDLAAVCDKCMAREPADRYQDMHDVMEDLRAFLRGLPVSANPLGPAERTRRWCRRNPIVAAFLATMTLGVGIVLWSLSSLGTSLVRQSATESAGMEAAILEDVNSLYSKAVAGRLDKRLVRVTHDYADHAGAVPIPATFLTELGDQVSSRMSGVHVRHYSDFPFRFRKDGGARDDFEREALTQLRADPATPFYRFEEVDGRASLRYATARVMKASCVECHNAHPDSTKTDWKTGDVRGVLEIIRPLDRDVQRTREGLQGTLLVLGGVGVLLLGFGTAIVVRRHRTEDRPPAPPK